MPTMSGKATLFEATRAMVTTDFHLSVGEVMTEHGVHEGRCRIQHRDPDESDSLATFTALEKLVADREIEWVYLFGSRCVRRLKLNAEVESDDTATATV